MVRLMGATEFMTEIELTSAELVLPPNPPRSRAGMGSRSPQQLKQIDRQIRCREFRLSNKG